MTIAHWSPRPEWKGSQAFYDAYVKKFGEDARLPQFRAAWMSLEILQSAVATRRARQGKDPRDGREGHLRHDQRQGALRGRAERHHADRLRADTRRASCRSSGRSRSPAASTSRRRASRLRRRRAPRRCPPPCAMLRRRPAVRPAAVRGAGDRLALRAGRARPEPGLRHDADAQRRPWRRGHARRLRGLLGVHLAGISPLVAAPVVAALGARLRRLPALPGPDPAPARRRAGQRRPGRGEFAAALLRAVDHPAERRGARVHAEQPRLPVPRQRGPSRQRLDDRQPHRGARRRRLDLHRRRAVSGPQRRRPGDARRDRAPRGRLHRRRRRRPGPVVELRARLRQRRAGRRAAVDARAVLAVLRLPVHDRRLHRHHPRRPRQRRRRAWSRRCCSA